MEQHVVDRRHREARLWRALAYAGRYGKQRLPDMMTMPLRDLATFNEHVSRIVEEEQRPRR